MLGLKLALKLLIILALLYAAFGLFLYFYQAKYIYHPTKQNFSSCNGFSGAEKVNHKGTRFYYKYNSEKLAIFYHGNAGSACDRSVLKGMLEESNYSYIFVEYSGYSNDFRKPSKHLLIKDANNVNDFLKNKNFDKIALIGESLGTGIASYHSSLSKTDKIILIAPFDSMKNLAKIHYPMYPSFLVTEDYDNLEYLKNFNNNLIIIHGANDEAIPLKNSKNLFANLKTQNKKLIEVTNAGHNDLYEHKEVLDSITGFLKE